MAVRFSRKGVKNFQGRNYGLFQLRGILSNIYDQIEKAGDRTTEKTLQELAPEFLAYVAKNEPGFNDYTGNLANSYAAKVFIKGKYLRTFFHDTGFHGTIHRTKNGARYAMLRMPPRHAGRRKKMRIEREGGGFHGTVRSVEGFGYKQNQKRYLKKWEHDKGYRNWTRKRYEGKRPRDKKGRFLAQSYIEIENQAPYAEMVQQAAGAVRHHYPVLRGARVERLTNRATMLVKTAYISELKKAGFKVS